MITVRKYHKNGKISDIFKYSNESDYQSQKHYKHVFYNLKGNWLPDEKNLRQLSYEKMENVHDKEKFIFSLFVSRIKGETQYVYLLYKTIEEFVDSLIAFSKTHYSNVGKETKLMRLFKKEYNKKINLRKTLEIVLSNDIEFNRENFVLKLMGSKIITIGKKFSLFKNGEKMKIEHETIQIIDEENPDEAIKENHFYLNFLNRSNGQYIDASIGLIMTEEDILFTAI